METYAKSHISQRSCRPAQNYFGQHCPSIYFKGEGSFWIDDVRVQPLDAQMNAYVYDPVTLRLLTSFDDQHFGLYYQYNAEGQLVRKLIETERGIKTVQEAQYHTPKIARKE
jgi:hypothetical protein